MGKVFSIEKGYQPSLQDPGERNSVDWNFLKPRVWARYWSPVGFTHWQLDGDGKIDEAARRAILKKFGLLDFEEEFPLEKIEKMSPVELLKVRREKEKIFNLLPLEELSDEYFKENDFN